MLVLLEQFAFLGIKMAKFMQKSHTGLPYCIYLSTDLAISIVKLVSLLLFHLAMSTLNSKMQLMEREEEHHQSYLANEGSHPQIKVLLALHHNAAVSRDHFQTSSCCSFYDFTAAKCRCSDKVFFLLSVS